MDDKSYRHNNEKLLKLWLQKFESDQLCIDISTNNNSNIWKDCEELGEVLDGYSSVKPFRDGSWSAYLPSRIGEWEYIRCTQDRNGKVTGTASEKVNCGVDCGREAITAEHLLEIVRGCEMLMDEDFDSVFD